MTKILIDEVKAIVKTYGFNARAVKNGFFLSPIEPINGNRDDAIFVSNKGKITIYTDSAQAFLAAKNLVARINYYGR